MGLMSSIGNFFSGIPSAVGNLFGGGSSANDLWQPDTSALWQPASSSTDWGNILGNTAAKGIGGLASNLLGSFIGGGNSNQQTQGGGFNPSNILGSLGGGLTNLFGGATNSISNLLSNPTGGSSVNKLSSQDLLDSLWTQAPQTMPVAQSQSGQSTFSKYFPQNYTGANLFSGGGGGGGGQQPSQTSSAQKSQGAQGGLGKILDTFKNALMGGQNSSQGGMLPGIMTMLGSRLIGNPAAPKLPQSVVDLQSRMRQPINPAAMQQMNNMITQPFQPMNEAEIQAALQQLNQAEQDALEAHREVYKNIRPDSDPLTDSTMAKDEAEIRDKFARAKADTIAGRTRDLQQIHTQNVLNATKMATGLTEQEIQNEVTASNYDIEEIMNKFNMDYADAVKLRDAVFEMGSRLTLNSFGVNQYAYPYVPNTGNVAIK